MMRVAVVGAGWAGCAAAVTLARLGHAATVFEAGAVPGGRARRVVRDGLPLDNGQHLLVGAYAQVRNLLAAVHGGDGEARLLVRQRLAVVPLAEAGFALSARLGLPAGLLCARGLTLRERLATAAWFVRLRRRGFRCASGLSVAELCGSGPAPAAEQLWFPLCLAALNTPPREACAQVFANVLRDTLAGRRGASDFLLPAADLSALFPEPALRFVEGRGGAVRLRTAARLVQAGDDGVTVAASSTREPFDAAVIAVGPHQLARAVDGAAFAAALGAAGALRYEPIATVSLGYGRAVPLPAPVVRLDDAPGQWLFDRSDVLARALPAATRPALAQLLAVVISAGGPHDALPAAALVRACDAQLRRLVPSLPALAWSQAIVERRATYACTPQRARAPSTQPHPRVALAGDWLDDEYPATLEAAARSGVNAAFALDAARRKRPGSALGCPTNI